MLVFLFWVYDSGLGFFLTLFPVCLSIHWFVWFLFLCLIVGLLLFVLLMFFTALNHHTHFEFSMLSPLTARMKLSRPVYSLHVYTQRSSQIQQVCASVF